MSINCHSVDPSGHASIKVVQRASPSSAESYANQAARILAADPTPYLWLRDDLQVPGHSVFDQDIETALADGLDISYYEDGYSGAFEAINGVGVVPQKIIFDCELPSTWAYFNLMADLNNDQRVALMQSWYDNAGIYARMTQAMKALNAESFRAQTAHLQEWSEWFTEVTVLEALRSIRDIARTIFGLPNLIATNYGDSGPQSFTALDKNGYPIAQASLTSGWSAPTLYPEVGRVTEGLDKHDLYNVYLNHLNTVRAQDMTQTTLWIPFPSQRVGFGVDDSFARWMWEEFVSLLASAGASDLILFNPGPACGPIDNDFAARVLAKFDGHTFTPIVGQAKIPLDSPSITMGVRTFEYPTFLGRLGGALLKKKKKRHK
jgi:hypothetical protein